MKLNLLITILAIYSKNIYALPESLGRCGEDLIGGNELIGGAEERVRWYAKCFYKEIENEVSGTTQEEVMTNWINFKIYNKGDPTKERRSVIKFPVFMNEHLTKVWVAPTNRNAPCDVPVGYKAKIFCETGCYAAGMKLSFLDGDIPIDEAKNQTPFSPLMVLDSSSTLGDHQWKYVDVLRYTEDIIPTYQSMLRIKTISGVTLELTTNHPLVGSDGNVRMAQSFKVNEALIKANGELDPIVSIEPYRFFGKVYNVYPNSTNITENIIVAEGVLNGSAWYQNDGLVYLNETVFRYSIPDELFERKN